MNAILSRLIDKCIRHGIIKDQETDVYRYGFDLLVFSLINIILLVFVGLAVNRAGSVALILLGYIPLQSMGGGYHADTHLRCMLLMLFDMGIADERVYQGRAVGSGGRVCVLRHWRN